MAPPPGLASARRRTPAQRLRRLIRRRVPLVTWLPSYSAEYVVADLVAGITLGLTLLPQSIAYAQLAGVSPRVSSRERDRRIKF